LVEVYGEDLFPELPRWRSFRGARGALRRTGEVADAFRALGAETVPRAFATSGDVAISPGLDNDELPRMAVIYHTKALCADRKDGTRLMPVSVLPGDVEVWRLP